MELMERQTYEGKRLKEEADRLHKENFWLTQQRGEDG